MGRLVDLADRAVDRLDAVPDDVPGRDGGVEDVLAIGPHVNARGHGFLLRSLAGFPSGTPAGDPQTASLAPVKTLLNVIWLVLAGFWLALAYLVAAILLRITIIGMPFAMQSLKLARLRALAVRAGLVRARSRTKG